MLNALRIPLPHHKWLQLHGWSPLHFCPMSFMLGGQKYRTISNYICNNVNQGPNCPFNFESITAPWHTLTLCSPLLQGQMYVGIYGRLWKWNIHCTDCNVQTKLKPIFKVFVSRHVAFRHACSCQVLCTCWTISSSPFPGQVTRAIKSIPFLSHNFAALQ